MNERFRGIVLSVLDYRESDQLIRVLTKEYGILSLVARSARKMTAKNRVLPLEVCEFLTDLKEGQTMSTLHSAKILEDHYEEKDIEILSFLNIFPDA